MRNMTPVNLRLNAIVDPERAGARRRNVAATRANPSGPIGALFCSFDSVA